MTVALVIAITLAVTVLDFVILFTIVHRGWGPLPRAYPARTPDDDAVRRSYQSFRLGLMNLGYCIHVAADEKYLHLVPIKPLRILGGRTASIPWDAIRIENRSRRGKWITTRVGTHTLRGPSWCLELASVA
jgi:hypothetical protein